MQATVHLDTHHHVGPIDRRLFGGFLEHLGRAVYEGVYDPGNPLSNEQGFRQDVLKLLAPLACRSCVTPVETLSAVTIGEMALAQRPTGPFGLTTPGAAERQISSALMNSWPGAKRQTLSR